MSINYGLTFSDLSMTALINSTSDKILFLNFDKASVADK